MRQAPARLPEWAKARTQAMGLRRVLVRLLEWAKARMQAMAPRLGLVLPSASEPVLTPEMDQAQAWAQLRRLGWPFTTALELPQELDQRQVSALLRTLEQDHPLAWGQLQELAQAHTQASAVPPEQVQ